MDEDRERRGGEGAESLAEDVREAIREVRSWIDAAESVVVLTGAGISTDSGIQDFRGPQGLWTQNPEAEKMATLQYYMADGELRKRAWQGKRVAIEQSPRPNSGHRALVELERRGRLHTLITQNVDGLHQDAGSDPARVVEIHGTLREVVCMSCGERGPMEETLERVRAGEEDPACQRCGGILKSATISFGQGLVDEDLARSESAANSCDLLIAIGSTLSVYPIAAVVPVAKEAGARIVIVNAGPTEMDSLADAVLRGSISEILPPLLAS
ncbi:MAG: NAD-dependent deacetylase [Deltaproteobacteria bacterium]|nr:NAD-dependent deacetylase [Deltaproteobacteria bacterium]